MNPLPPNADELVSAYLDGEAAPDEVTIVESSPELMGRVGELRAISSQLGMAPSAPAAHKETHIAAALDAFDALFAATDSDATTESEEQTPELSALPSLAVTSDPVVAPSAAAETTTVRSLDAARERRRPRRFNTGVIAAAAAVMLLFVAAAALSFGRGNSTDDVATASDSLAAAEVSIDQATDDEDTVEEPNALRSLDPPAASAPQGTAAPAPETAAVQADDAASDESSESAEIDEAAGADQAMAEEAMADSDAADEAADDDRTRLTEDEDTAANDEAEAGESEPFYSLGRFDNRAQLKAGFELDTLDISIETLLEGVTEFESGIIPTCRNELPEHTDDEPDLVVADVFLEDDGWIVAEVYVFTNPDRSRDVYVLDSDDCTLIAALEDK